MAFRKKKYTRKRKRYPRRKRGKSVGAKLLRQARTDKADSKLEKAVKIIATRQAKKLVPSNLILRNYWFSDYNPITGMFTNSTSISKTGDVIAIAQIALLPQQEITVAQATQQSLDPALRPNPQYLFGNTFQGQRRGNDGYRRGDVVTIKNVQLGVKAWVDKIDYDGQNAFHFKDCRLYYALVSVEELHAQQVVAGHVPQVQELFRPAIWGFTSRLDVRDNARKQGRKVNILKRGTIKFTFSMEGGQERFRTHFIDLKGGIKIRYTIGAPQGQQPDLYGQQVSGMKKLYVAVWSDKDVGVNIQYKPKCAMYTKVGYVDT